MGTPEFTGLAILDSESNAFLKDIQQQGFHLAEKLEIDLN